MTKDQLLKEVNLLKSELEQLRISQENAGNKDNISINKITEEKLLQRDKYLSALNQSKKILLTASKEHAFQQFVDILGAASNSSRTYIFINHTSAKGEPLMSQKAEYCAYGITPEIDNPDLQGLKYDDFFKRWNDTLSKGKIIFGKIKDFPIDEKKFLELQDIKAILIIPIMTDNKFLGFIGFDNCVSEREWDKAEQNFLHVAANDLAQFIEKNKIQEQLIAENIRFQTTMDAMDAVVYVADMQNYELLYLNELGKISTNGKVGDKCYSALQKGQTKPCDFCTNHLLLDKKGNPKKPYTWEFKNTITNKWYQLRDKAILWPDGRMVRLEIATDISERKQAERSKIQSEEKYRKIFEHAPIGIITIDKDGNPIDMNQRTLEILGSPSAEATKKINVLTYRGLVESGFSDDFMKCIKTKEVITSEKYYTSKWKKHGYIRYILTPIVDNNNLITGVQAIYEDITERKEIDKQLKKLSAAVNQSGNTIVITDIEGNIEYTNPKFTELSGYTAEEALGKNPSILNAGTQPKEYYTEMWQTISAGKTWKGEFNNITKNGNAFWENVTISPIKNDDGIITNYLAIKEDITEFKHTKKALQESENKFKETVNMLPQIVFEIDLEGTFVFVNKQAVESLGYSNEDIINGFNFQNALIPEDRDRVAENLNKMKRGDSDREYNYTALRKDGTTFPVVIYSNLIIRNNKTDGVRGIAVDVTTIRLAEQELIKAKEKAEESEIKLKEAQTTAHLGNWELDLGKNKLTWSNEIYKIFELNPQKMEATYEEFLNRVHPEDRQMVNIAYTNSLVYKEPYETEHRLIFKNGDIKYVKEQCRTKFDKNGKPLLSIGIVQDITVQKETEKELERSHGITQQERNMFVAGPVVAFKWRNEEGWPVEYVSPNAMDILGYSVEELMSDDLLYSNLIFNEDIERVGSEVSFNSKSGTESFTHQPYRIIHKDGKNIWVIDYTTIIRNKNNDITHYLGYILDITDRKTAETELKMALVKAKESDRLKTAFLQNISHEIRTPMNGILGFSGLLKNPSLKGSEQQSYVDIILKAGQRMLETLDDLMNISMLETGQVKFVLSTINVNNRLKSLFEFFSPEVEKKGMQLKVNTSLPTNEVNIETDSQKFYAILTNLIKNAIKYCNDGSIEFGYLRKGKTLEFYVKDTGIGIAKHRREAIFDRFVQADIEDARVYEGVGLGLSITKAYVEMIGGKIWLESEIDQGSQFYFTIPYTIDKTGNETKTANRNLGNQTRKIKMLIVEDEKVTDEYLTIILDGISNPILHAETGEEAVELCRQNPDIDLVLMDIKMPVMSGYEACRKIREFNKDVIIIAQTAYALTGDREKAINAGCDDYISKPIDKNGLMEMIGNLLTKNKKNHLK